METATQPAAGASTNGSPRKEDPRPLGGYAALMTAYSAGMGAYLWWRGRSKPGLPERIGPGDLALLGVATHKISRLIAKDKVTAPLRAQFTEYEGKAGPAEESESVAGDGSRAAVGELLACPFCLDQWVASALAIGLVEAARPTRFVMAIFAGVAASDFLQIAYKTAQDQLE
jgi:Protein of unknown function (DUF1360)